MAQPARRSADDQHPTETSELQAETESVLLKHIPLDSESLPPLQRGQHLQFLVRNLIQGFPSRYTSQDASQPWLLYWTLQSFSAMGVVLDPNNKQRAINKILAWQHPEGGFGGGPGQAAHLLTTYASVCSLAIVGRPGRGGGWDQINRQTLYAFFMSLKQPDGSFLVAHDAEVDVRGTYCLLVVAYLLDLLTPELLRGTPGFIASCQTYEGGFSSASLPYYRAADGDTSGEGGPLLEDVRPPLGEAHGGYTFCALASWIMVQPYLRLASPPPTTRTTTIAYTRLLRWLVQMQGAESELGGFRGRTNKLVDGCYSWWVGGCFALLQSVGVGVGGVRHVPDVDARTSAGTHDATPDGEWVDDDDSVWDKPALQRYILCAAQHPAAGLRDKPPKAADAYHTLYCLAGLSAAQHNVNPLPARRAQVDQAWRGRTDSDAPEERLRRASFADALAWTEEEGASHVLGGSVNRVNATHPVFNLTLTHTEGIMSHFYRQTIPRRTSN